MVSNWREYVRFSNDLTITIDICMASDRPRLVLLDVSEM